MQKLIHPNTRVLKPMQIAAKSSLKPYQMMQKCLKPMRITAKVNQTTIFAAICMGFKRFWKYLLLYTWVLRWDLLKPMQKLIHPNTRVLKPMQIAAKSSLKPYQMMQKCLKPMRITAKVNQTTIFAAICMGFKRFWKYLLLYTWVLRWDLLKPM